MRFFGRATHFLRMTEYFVRLNFFSPRAYVRPEFRRMTGMFNSADGADVKAKKKDIYAL